MNSTNIKVMSEEIQHLKNEVHNLDVEIPAHPSTDVGKYLGVAADGSLAWSKVPDELPPTTGATAGQILALDNDKAPEWVDNYNLKYSENEILTGKMFNNKPVYCKYITGYLPDSTGTVIATSIEIGSTIVSYDLFIYKTITTYSAYAKQSIYMRNNTGEITFDLSNMAFVSGNYSMYIEYIKPDPSALTSSDPNREAEPEIIEEPETETKSTRTKKSTK